MFAPTLIITAGVLLYMHFIRSFIKLQIGMTYRSRAGSVVKIVDTTTIGPISIFVDHLGRRYYSNGEAVDHVGTWSPDRLYERLNLKNKDAEC